MRHGTHVNAAAAGMVSLVYSRRTIDQTCSRKIRPWQMLHDAINVKLGIFNQGDGGINDFIQVMRWNIGGHTNRNAGRAIDQQSGNPGWHNQWLVFGFIVIWTEVDGFLGKISQQFMGQFRHADFGITHGCCGITVYRTKVTLAIHQHVTHCKRLRHTNDGVVNGRITVRMIFTNYITHHAGGFFVCLVPVITQFTHGKKHTPVYRFQTIPDIG